MSSELNYTLAETLNVDEKLFQFAEGKLGWDIKRVSELRRRGKNFISEERNA